MMVEPSSIARIIPSLAGRPPTPPRDADPPPESKPGIFGRLFSKGPLVTQIPQTTPTSSRESLINGDSFRKKVAWDDNADISTLSAGTSTPRERKPLKSILKPYNGNLNRVSHGSKLSPPHTYANLAAMLESVAKQLSGNDRSSKIDSYKILLGSMKASEHVPDIRALKDKLGLFLQFVRRDINAKTPNGSLDTSLIVSALDLLAIFLHKPAVAENFKFDISTYIVDYATRSLENETTPKDIVKHVMFVMAEQNFTNKVMNGDRVGKLLAALYDIDKRVKGKSIVVGRISIYRTLVRQSKSHMLANTSWLENVLGDMFSSVKDTRAHAITFGLEAGLVLGNEPKATQAFMDIFMSTIDLDVGDTSVKFGDYYSGRLKAMVSSKLDVASVPQIWTIPILLLRSRPRQFEQWHFMKAWLAIIQACFNCSDPQAKFEANLAWNRLVYALKLDNKTSPGTVTLLVGPLLTQIKRRGHGGRRAALGSLCNLLYYTLKPSSTHAQLDLSWDRYFEPLGKTLVNQKSPTSSPESIRQDSLDASSILAALFDSTTPRLWSEHRAMDSCSGKDTSMEASELPALDSKWLRKNSGRVFKILGPLLEKLYWDLGDETEIVTNLWRSYITSIASPALMEVKVSNETMSCVASMFGLLYRIWQSGPKGLKCVSLPEEPLSEDFLLSFERIVTTAIEGLGLLPFTQKLLAIGGEHKFIVIATPSHQPKKTPGEPGFPLHHLFVLLTHVSPELHYDQRFAEMARKLLLPFFDARPLKQGKLALAQDLLTMLPTDGSKPVRMMWSILANLATLATDIREDPVKGASNNTGQPLGSDYRAALTILEHGIELSPNEPLPGWSILFQALVTSATLDAGDGGRAVAVIEPLGRVLYAKFGKKDVPPNMLGSYYYHALLSKATYAKDRQSLEAARRRIWISVAVKPSGFDPYDLFYDFIRQSLQRGYQSFSKSQCVEYADMMTATTTLLTNCPPSLVMNVLVKVQSGIAAWIKDEGLHIPMEHALGQAVTLLWSKICNIISMITHSSTRGKILEEIEVLICSGLESRHRSLANASIAAWNSTFGDAKEQFVYSEALRAALLPLYAVASSDSLLLPFFLESLESNSVDQCQLPKYVDTQISQAQVSESFAGPSSRNRSTPRSDLTPRSFSRLQNYTPQVVITAAQSVPSKRSRESTPEPNRRKTKKRSVAKLRHDDSQIQFEAIVSSPVADTVSESQLLTERQKEVKERQEAEAAMFPDLRSSPRNRRDSRPDVDLPLHRSSSKPYASTSPVNKRQTTPTLAPQMYYDDFVNSSPTPTRALHDTSNLLDMPSSPPKANQDQSRPHSDEDTELPSSPPDIPEESDLDVTTSIEPPAQTAQKIPDSFILTTTEDGHTGRLQAAASANKFKMASGEDENVEEEVSVSKSMEEEDRPLETPGTPRRSRLSSPAAFQTPRSEIFHDTQTSPASSDKNTLEDDVFEDAVSSPRSNMLKSKSQETSSPLSYLDESSALRLMEGYDRGSGRPRRSVRFPSGQAHQSQPEKSVQASGFVPSPIPSLIAETPAPKAKDTLLPIDGEVFDPNETIVVDESLLARRNSPAPARRSRKRKSDDNTIRTPAGKKGKHGGVVSNVDEDCRNIQPEVFSPKKVTSPEKQKAAQQGPPKRSSRLASLSQSPSRQASFDDTERSIQASQNEETMAKGAVHSSIFRDAVVPDAHEMMVEHSFISPPADNEVNGVAEAMESGVRGNEAENKITGVPKMRVNISEIEMVADTILNANSSLENSEAVAELEKDAPGVAVSSTSRILTMASEPATEVLPSEEGASMQTDVITERASAQGLRSKLQSIIGDLRNVALTREEMNELEDLFVDAKEQLYGASRRGRSAS